jgi:hypothetical protein
MSTQHEKNYLQCISTSPKNIWKNSADLPQKAYYAEEFRDPSILG